MWLFIRKLSWENVAMENNEAITTDVEDSRADAEQSVKTEIEPQKKHCGFSRLLNKYFHHIDRGGSLGGEIGAGITMLILSVCSIFLTMQVIANNNGGTLLAATESADFYVATYLAAMLVSFAGTLVIGIVARLPFVQVSSLSLTTTMISLVGADNGLTYYNLIFISFISSVLYAALVSIPVVKNFVYRALPASICKILPAVAGAIIIVLAVQSLGLVNVNGLLASVQGNAPTEYGWGGVFFLPQIASGYAGDALYGAMYAGLVAGFLAIICYVIMKSLKVKHPVGWTLLIGTLLYFGVAAIIDINLITGWARLWLIGSEDTLQTHLSSGFSQLFGSFGKVFSTDGGGLDFSAYTGNAGVLVIGGMLCFLMLSMYDGQAAIEATSGNLGVNTDTPKGVWIAQACNAGAGVVSAVFGTTPVALGKQAVAGSDDNAKSGISSIVVAVGLLVSMFVWIVPALMATYVNLDIAFANGEYGHYDMGSLQMTLYCTFGVADAVMIAMGIKMMKSLGDLDYKNTMEWVPAIVTLVSAVLTVNLAYGVAFGVVAYCIIKLFAFAKDGETLGAAIKNNFVANVKTFPIPTAVLGALSLTMLLMLLL